MAKSKEKDTKIICIIETKYYGQVQAYDLHTSSETVYHFILIFNVRCWTVQYFLSEIVEEAIIESPIIAIYRDWAKWFFSSGHEPVTDILSRLMRSSSQLGMIWWTGQTLSNRGARVKRAYTKVDYELLCNIVSVNLKLSPFKEKFFPSQNFNLFIACSCGGLLLF